MTLQLPSAIKSSFALPSLGNDVEILIDGENTMARIYDAMMLAKSYVWVSDWLMSVDVPMKRPAGKDWDTFRVGNVLGYLAEEKSLDVRVIIYNSPDWPPGAYIGERDVLAYFQQRKVAADARGEARGQSVGHVKIFAHRPDVRYTNHQKLVVIDGKIAFVGGVDLAEGRWDTSEHNVLDPPAETIQVTQADGSTKPVTRFLHEGNDYYNSVLPQPKKGQPRADRNVGDPRMPWHDVHCVITGDAAKDVAFNFYQRWTNTKSMESIDLREGEIDRATVFANYPPPPPTAGAGQEPPPLNAGQKKVYVQVLRSLGPTTGNIDDNGNALVEHSVMDGYIEAIRNADHFVYIENQFFSSDFASKVGFGANNKVMDAIATRIEKAVAEDKKAKASNKGVLQSPSFVCVIIIPYQPEGDDITGYNVQCLLHWQYQTLGGDKSGIGRIVPSGALWNRVKVAAKSISAEPSRYLSIHSLRNFAPFESTVSGRKQQMYVTEQIYPHVKLLIVDDRLAILGSANINDRSMLGDRDSEICARLFDTVAVSGKMGGQDYEKGKLIRDLRVALWLEHLRPTNKAAQLPSDPQEATVEDPIMAHNLWKARSATNTSAYNAVFKNLPRNDWTWLGLRTGDPAIHSYRRTEETWDPAQPSKEGHVYKQRLDGVRGHLVDLPLDWLRNENLQPPGTGSPLLHLLGAQRLFQ